MSTIMIVEDELLEQEFLQEIVTKETLPDDKIVACTTGTQSIEMAQQYQPNIILMDVFLPEIDGLHALQEIRQFLPDASTIILSGCADFTYAQKAIRLRVQEYLLKPIRPDEFRQTFRKVLQNQTVVSPSPSLNINKSEKLIPTNSTYTGVVEKSLQYIRENFKQKISLKDIANHVYMNPQYVSRIFKKEVGMSCIDYINTLKIEYACKLLETTNETVYYIATDCGFFDQSYFDRVFASQMGMTPKVFRRQCHDTQPNEMIRQ